MAIHILTSKRHPFSCCGIDLSTKEHSFMFGTVNPTIDNVCESCKEIFLKDSENSVIVEITETQQGPL